VKEERIMDGTILIAVNKHREICMLQAMGGIQLNRDQVLTLTLTLY
jgi:exosome complex component RRP45